MRQFIRELALTAIGGILMAVFGVPLRVVLLLAATFLTFECISDYLKTESGLKRAAGFKSRCGVLMSYVIVSLLGLVTVNTYWYLSGRVIDLYNQRNATQASVSAPVATLSPVVVPTPPPIETTGRIEPAKETQAFSIPEPAAPTPEPKIDQPAKSAPQKQPLDVRLGFSSVMLIEDAPRKRIEWLMNILNLSKTESIVLDFTSRIKYSGGALVNGARYDGIIITQPNFRLPPSPGIPAIPPNLLYESGTRLAPQEDVNLVFDISVLDGVDTSKGMSGHELLLIAEDRISKRRAAKPILKWSDTQMMDRLIRGPN